MWGGSREQNEEGERTRRQKPTHPRILILYGALNRVDNHNVHGGLTWQTGLVALVVNALRVL